MFEDINILIKKGINMHFNEVYQPMQVPKLYGANKSQKIYILDLQVATHEQHLFKAYFELFQVSKSEMLTSYPLDHEQHMRACQISSNGQI